MKNFQEVGSQKKMTIEDKEFLNNHLSDLNKWLIDYFVFGINNKMLNNIQIAQALLVFNPLTGQCQIKSIKETEEEMLHEKWRHLVHPLAGHIQVKSVVKKYR